MKIPVHLSKTSINGAKRKLNNIIKQLEEVMLNELLYECCQKVIQLANDRVDQTTIGSNVKAAIKSGWQPPEISKGVAVIRNTDDKAVYVEFGVGIVGEEDSHARATVVNYSYNIGSQIASDGSWVFVQDNHQNIDIQAEHIDNIDGGRIITTHGSPAVMYAYNAIIDLKEKYIQSIWQSIKEKYWG